MIAAQREARLIRHYIRALGLWAVWRAADAAGRTEAGISQDVQAAERRLAVRGLTAFEAWWAPSRAAAERALQAVERGAGGTGLTSHATVMIRARQVIAQVSAKIDRANRVGELRHLNAGYRQLRLRREALGLTTYPYSPYLDRYAVLMLRETAAQIRASAPRR